MKIEEFKNNIYAALEENPHHLDTLSNVKCLGRPEEINSIVKSLGMLPVKEEVLRFLQRAWPYKAELEDGTFYFLAWDLGNCANAYLCKLDTCSINTYYARQVFTA